MDDRPEPQHHPAGILNEALIVAGLGPGDLSRTPAGVRAALLDPDRDVILRTAQHPAAAQLAQRRRVTTCDDLYDAGETFDEVYEAIVSRVLAAAEMGPVIYATPGSPLYGERTVAVLRARCRAAGRPVELLHAPSFLDEVFSALQLDPTERGFTVLDGRDLPDPLMLHLPTVVFQVDTGPVLDDALRRLGRTLPEGTPVTVLSDLGTEKALVRTYPIGDVPADAANARTSLFLDPPETGLVGAIRAMRRLRKECPWDQRQTHDSLTPYAVEETFELLEAIGRLPHGAPGGDDIDYVAYHDVEEELGDVLLQVIFHSNLASETGAFDVEDVAETLRRKLVRRHPHVFGTLEVQDAEEVIANWVEIKAGEKHRESLMDGVPGNLPGLDRAVKLQKRATRVGFDWPDARSVVGDVEEEIAELVEVIDQGEEADHEEADHELGDVLFAVANLARHLGVPPELALRKAVNRFETRFRRMEELDDLAAADLDRLDALWEQAKHEERH
ncbi:MAG: nucleoside triphosphate pyrophosphohydrolase [Acidimicrobiia bacterium]|nr:nucleoside triphosphate pyrophosphohydrolase [Acidimicrobiia bacterium]MYF84448.1 nucleoside triphosphate pyrophosphohydrolase [Acidimicrobiia bacterium]